QSSGRQPGLSRPVKSLHGKTLMLAQLRLDFYQVVFGNVEHNRDRLKFGDDSERVRTARKDCIACIDKPETNPSGSGSCNVAVAQLYLGVCHLTKIVFDRSLILDDGLFLIVKDLLGNCVRSE